MTDNPTGMKVVAYMHPDGCHCSPGVLGCVSLVTLADAEAAITQWRPIKTAPRDGRQLILLLTPSNWPQMAWSNTWWRAGFSVECEPTHWAPMPQPAAAALSKLGEKGNV